LTCDKFTTDATFLPELTTQRQRTCSLPHPHRTGHGRGHVWLAGRRPEEHALDAIITTLQQTAPRPLDVGGLKMAHWLEGMGLISTGLAGNGVGHWDLPSASTSSPAEDRGHARGERPPVRPTPDATPWSLSRIIDTGGYAMDCKVLRTATDVQRVTGTSDNRRMCAGG
jgi:hypothetical protein